MEGVDSFLKRSHSGVTPAKMAKESTPGNSDSWNRCNPMVNFLPAAAKLFRRYSNCRFLVLVSFNEFLKAMGMP